MNRTPYASDVLGGRDDDDDDEDVDVTFVVSTEDENMFVTKAAPASMKKKVSSLSESEKKVQKSSTNEFDDDGGGGFNLWAQKMKPGQWKCPSCGVTNEKEDFKTKKRGKVSKFFLENPTKRSDHVFTSSL